ncbi:EthD family reductase [Methylopila musalis]|uniref:EthD family reductase n=1 Tax=Methylopila musalis TaxID=1134781 RepID=A0ABW3Z5B4_9HYPH
MSKLIVMYKTPADPAHFDRHFREVHMPLVEKMPGLRGYSFGPASGLDGSAAAFFWVFVGTFDNLDAINAALGSPEGQAAVADIPNYNTGGDATILHLDSTEG